MQTLGVGVDIIENSRIKKSIKNKKFLSRIFSKIEITNSKKNNRPNFGSLTKLHFGNRLKLHISSAFIDLTYFSISIIFFCRVFFGKTVTAEEFNCF